ncbi:GDSL esterase/lipase At3g26430-like isoform X1 [Ananas comosus]|uniref:GDSL esterase/lipase At3g26430-like isoform X1 n=1 Tax=Ananas comosus TaxID=4615 RepID=A0A6P5GN35_ANACO|nr:GDSL esterase/lipase At3g26430-like isoform X1 [Ananas comosus]
MRQLFLLSCLLCLLLPVSSSACSFPAIFNFGDSNSDTGGLSSSFSIGPVNLPYGETFFGFPSGRFSDGRLLVDFVAGELGLPRLCAYLDSLCSNFSRGANFATALSTIVPQNTTLPLGVYSPFSLDVQLKQFLLFKSRLQMVYRKGGAYKDLVPQEGYIAKALYTIDIGQNDLTALYFSNMSAEEYLPNALKEFSTVIKRIYRLGGRYFWIHNTGPLGCLPYVLVQVPLNAARLDRAGCSILFNDLARRFNSLLNETVVQLRKELPLAALTLVDIFSVKYSLISQAKKNGFEHPLRSCCGDGSSKYNYNSNARCGDTAMKNGIDVLIGKSCKDPTKSIIWDGVHYTEAANKWIFDQISKGLYSDPPISLSSACYRNPRKA